MNTLSHHSHLPQDVQGSRIAESRAMRHNSFLGTFGEAMNLDETGASLNKAIAGITVWFVVFINFSLACQP